MIRIISVCGDSGASRLSCYLVFCDYDLFIRSSLWRCRLHYRNFVAGCLGQRKLTSSGSTLLRVIYYRQAACRIVALSSDGGGLVGESGSRLAILGRRCWLRIHLALQLLDSRLDPRVPECIFRRHALIWFPLQTLVDEVHKVGL